MMTRFIPILGIALMIAGCSQPKEKAVEVSQPEIEEVVKEVCSYAYEPTSTEVLWVAYKYIDQTGVKAVFDSVWVEGTSTSADPLEVLSESKFKIKTASCNSGDPTRDPKIIEYFFGNLQGSEFLTGEVSKIDGDEKGGSMIVDLTMNGLKVPIEGSYSLDGEKFEFSAEISIESWAAGAALGELNKVCEDLHKGSDGMSVLWPDVSLFVSTTFSKECEDVASLD